MITNSGRRILPHPSRNCWTSLISNSPTFHARLGLLTMSKPNLGGVQSPAPAALIGPATSHKAAYNSFLVVLTDERQRWGADKKNTTTHHRQHSQSTDYSGYFLHLSRHLAVHNLNPGSLSDNRGEIEIDFIATMLHSAELRFFAFCLSAVRPVQSISVACTPPRPQHSLWGVKLQPSDRAANYSST